MKELRKSNEENGEGVSSKGKGKEKVRSEASNESQTGEEETSKHTWNPHRRRKLKNRESVEGEERADGN